MPLDYATFLATKKKPTSLLFTKDAAPVDFSAYKTAPVVNPAPVVSPIQLGNLSYESFLAQRTVKPQVAVPFLGGALNLKPPPPPFSFKPKEVDLAQPFSTPFSGKSSSFLPFLKEVGQSVARNIGSAALSISGKIQGKTADPLKAEDFDSYLGQALFETMFGVGQEIKPIETRIAEAEPKFDEWKRELEDISNTPGLNAREKLVTTVLSNLDTGSTVFMGIMGSVGLDITPFGSTRKGVTEVLIKSSKPADAISVLMRMGVPEDLAKFHAQDVVAIKTTSQADAFLDNLQGTIKTTKVAERAPTAPVSPVARSIEPRVGNAISQENKVTEAFNNSTAQKPVGSFEIGTFGENQFAKKATQKDRFPISELPITVQNVTHAYRASDNPANYRYNNIAWVADISNGETRVIYTRQNARGAEEILNAHTLSDPRFEQTLKTFGAPDQSRTGILSLERSTPIPLADGGIAKPSIISPKLQVAQKRITGGLEQKIELATMERELMRDVISENQARGLSKFASRKTGELPEVTGEKGKGIFRQKGDDIVTERGFPDSESAREAFVRYKELKISEQESSAVVRELKASRAESNKLVAALRNQVSERKALVNAVDEVYGLSEKDITRASRGRDFRQMSDTTFREFTDNLEKIGGEVAERRQARIQLEATIQEKELQKWENIRDLLKLPKSFSEMTVEQLNKLDEVLSQYKTGDEFLPVRMMETLPATALKDAKTMREVLEVLAKEKGITVEQAGKIKVPELGRFMGGHTLARQHPFFDLLVRRNAEGFLESNARIIELTDGYETLIKAARASRPRGLLGRLVPTDSQITKWLQVVSGEEKAALAREMTEAELKAGQYQEKAYRAYYEDLVKKHAGKKFSRFEDQYYPHVRRPFLEAAKEDGFLKALKETQDKFAQEEKLMGILNERTGEILPYEKWIGFTQFRSGALIPTENTAKAFEAYVTTLERARYLDAMTPEVMAYVHALSPKRLTPKGLEMDTSLKRFTKEWLNANKGRVPKGFFEPGSRMDWGLRSSVTLTRFFDLAYNLPTQFVSPAGEQMMTLTMLKPKAYALAAYRFKTSQGRAIATKYKNFVGRTFWDELTRASNTAGDTFMSGAYSIFGVATRRANATFLLGKMTPDEFATGVISTERLAKLTVEMGKYRKVKGMESIMGRTGEGAVVTQYKGWAMPALRATITNTGDLVGIIRSKGVKAAFASDEGKELFYSIGISSAIGVGTYSYYQDLKTKKDRNFVEDTIFKGLRDSMTILGAIDPKTWTSVRIADFYADFGRAMTNLVWLEEYKTKGKGFEKGDLKGVQQLQRMFTPAPVRQIQKELVEPQSEFDKMQEDQTVKSAEEKEKFQPVYDNLQSLIASGKESEAQVILDKLTDAEYKIYKRIKTSQKTADTKAAQEKLFPLYTDIQEMIAEGREDEAQAILDGMTDEEYRIYKLLKERFQ